MNPCVYLESLPGRGDDAEQLQIVRDMLAGAFAAMAGGVRNHAEFVGDGHLTVSPRSRRSCARRWTASPSRA